VRVRSILFGNTITCSGLCFSKCAVDGSKSIEPRCPVKQDERGNMATLAAAGIQFLYQSPARIRTVGGQSAVPSGTVRHITRITSETQRRQYDRMQARRSRLDSQQEDFLLASSVSRPALRHTQSPVRLVLSDLLPEVNGPERELHHSSSPSAEVTTAVCSTSLASCCQLYNV
jgi:hypothetical protein